MVWACTKEGYGLHVGGKVLGMELLDRRKSEKPRIRYMYMAVVRVDGDPTFAPLKATIAPRQMLDKCSGEIYSGDNCSGEI